MAEKDKVFYWIKLKKEFMDSETVDFLMSQKNGANYIVLYQMLIMRTINTNGKLCNEIGEVLVPFDAEKIQRDCKWFDIDTVRVAMELYSKLGLIYKNDDGILQINNFEDMVGSETYWAKQKRLQKINRESVGNFPTNVQQKSNFLSISNISNLNSNIYNIKEGPTKEEVVEYAKSKDREDLAEDFYAYYTADEDPKKWWYDKDGKKVKSWKQKFITWTTHSEKPKDSMIRQHYTKEQIDGMITNLDEAEV